jgi:rhodanese-related sulfurtransferase
MSEAPCQNPDCNETVELPGEQAIARVTSERLPPPEREVVVMCPRGHRSVYVLRA